MIYLLFSGEAQLDIAGSSDNGAQSAQVVRNYEQ